MKTIDPAVSTRDKLMDAAQELMLSKGYVAAAVGEICNAAGVTKGSFFHYFDCKESLGKALLHRFTERQSACFADGCCGIDDPLQRVFALVDSMIASSRDPGLKGCLVGVLAQEISETHPELRKICEQAFSQFALGVARDLQSAKERHRHCPDPPVPLRTGSGR